MIGLCLPQFATADETQPADNNILRLSGYFESYYIHDFNQQAGHQRPGFVYSHDRGHTPSINLALVKAALETEKVRANLAIGSGSYMRANYAAEPDDLQKIYEANIGLVLSASNNLWLDVGVFPSHIGFESAIGSDNWTVTRSMLADNSPYFETGAKITYTSDDGKWLASGLVLNGWQRIQRADGNTTPAFGHQLTYKPNSRVTLNSSSFIGNDKSDRERRMRYFHHFYGQFQLHDRLSLITGFDIGAEQKRHNSSDYHVWLTPIVIAKYQYSDQLSFAARAEYYQDKDGVIIDTGTPHGFRTASYSANIDYQFNSTIQLRTELRKYHSKDKLFQDSGKLSEDNLILSTALCLRF